MNNKPIQLGLSFPTLSLNKKPAFPSTRLSPPQPVGGVEQQSEVGASSAAGGAPENLSPDVGAEQVGVVAGGEQPQQHFPTATAPSAFGTRPSFLLKTPATLQAPVLGGGLNQQNPMAAAGTTVGGGAPVSTMAPIGTMQIGGFPAGAV